MKIKIYVDGAVSFNGKSNAIGGWAYILVDENDTVIKFETGQLKGATNQEMELTAASRACTHAYAFINGRNFSEYTDDGFSCGKNSFSVYSDSAYLINCYNDQWWKKWILNNWRTSTKKTVANKELWLELIPFFESPVFSFHKVQAHSGDKYNSIVDELAVSAKLC